MRKRFDHLNLDVEFVPSNRLVGSDPAVPDVRPRTVVLPKDSVIGTNAYPLPCGIVVDYDEAIPMPDGAVLRADVYRPVTNDEVPAIFVYTPYCKRGGWWNKHFDVTRFGVDPASLSGLQAFEAPDPGFWCNHGYAVVVVDAAGTSHSGGDHLFMGTASARRAADALEWIATRDWCSGKVGMAGNSQLAMIQWSVAALKPAHLAAIAPWEGLVDPYREVTMRGGIIDQAFHDEAIEPFIFGETFNEDLTANCVLHPLMNAYWEDKRPRLSDADVPAYVVASWTSPIHTYGTLRGFQDLGTANKWLRIHNTQEWVDLADKANVEDLRRFFDHFLKGIDNGWLETPRVRLSILDPGGTDVVGREEEEWPLARQRQQILYLDAGRGQLTDQLPDQGAVDYDSRDIASSARFILDPTEDIEITGYLNLKLWIETDDGDDLDLFAALYKEDAQGRRLHHIVFSDPGVRQWVQSLERDGMLPATLSYTGPVGRLRVSRRALDRRLSRSEQPVLSHRQEELVSPGEVVAVDLALWPTSLIVHAGERLVVEIAGHATGPLAAEAPLLPGSKLTLATRNRGRHRIHTGGQRPSSLSLPLISR